MPSELRKRLVHSGYRHVAIPNYEPRGGTLYWIRRDHCTDSFWSNLQERANFNFWKVSNKHAFLACEPEELKPSGSTPKDLRLAGPIFGNRELSRPIAETLQLGAFHVCSNRRICRQSPELSQYFIMLMSSPRPPGPGPFWKPYISYQFYQYSFSSVHHYRQI